MKPWKRLLYYLAINVVVSVASTLTVIWLWNRAHPMEPAPVIPPVVPTRPPPTATPLPTLPPTQALTVYVVQPGDSLSSIALQFGIGVDELMSLNGLDNPNALGVGQQLFVPLKESRQTASPAPTSTATEVPAAGQVLIAEVFAPGELRQEGVLIRRVGGRGDLSLEGWVLQDSDGNRYVFPRLTLFPGGAVSVFTRAGVDTVVELYWGREQAVFTAGETVVLLDASGQEQSRYKVP